MPPTKTANKTWTTRGLLAWMTQAFEQKDLDSPRLFAELLLSHVIGCERLKLYMEVDRPATPLERQTLRDLVGRALNHEPVQYLVSEAWFFGLPFHVDSRVLIPRPSTETIVEHILQHVRAEPGFGGEKGEGLLGADICTGSGCIAITLAKNLPGARIIATDISPDAIEVAHTNAERHDVADRVELLQGDLLGALADHPAAGRNTLHLIASNPPYIPDHEWPQVEPNVKDYEPHAALRAGADGLDFISKIIETSPPLLRPHGMFLIETAASHAKQAAALLEAQPGITDVHILRDNDGLDRVVVGRKSHEN